MKRLFIIVGLIVSFFPLAANAAILRNLKMGDSGQDVLELQQALNSDPAIIIAFTGPGSPGNETAYFGVLTKAAVIKLQNKYATDILAPAGLTTATGFVGGQTRLFLLRLAGAGNSVIVSASVPASVPVSLPPTIAGISPAVVTKSTTELTITGANFAGSDNAVLVSSEDPGAFTGIRSPDGKTITFQFHFSTADALKKQLDTLVTSGRYSTIASKISKNIQERNSTTGNAQIPVTVVVRNASGASSPATLLIDITEILKEIGQ